LTHDQVLSCAMDIGENMLVSGAEVYRVEDCIRRICYAYGATDADVFTITSSIVLTIEFSQGIRVTQTRRIESYVTDLERVDRLNQLSRQMCSEKLGYDAFCEQFSAIMQKKRYPFAVEVGAFALIAAVFTVFFGGSWLDAVISALIGVVLKYTVHLTAVVKFNHVLSNLIASFVMSFLAFCAVNSGIPVSAEMIIIGNTMLLIPGILLTNSIRDMISGDTMAGLLRFAEAIILALAIAAGYILAFYAIGGGL